MRPKLDLKAAAATAGHQPGVPMTLAELAQAFTLLSPGDYVFRLRKWIDAFEHTSAWDVTTEQLEACAQAMREAGLKESTVNRDLSALGTLYRWAKTKRYNPKGFRSPTLGVTRQAEDIRRVEVSPEQLQALRDCSRAMRDRRFGSFVHLLMDTGARKSELLQRRWSEVDLEAGTILCPTTKTGIPRILHFQAETAALMKRAWPQRAEGDLLFEGRIKGCPVNYRKAWMTMTAELGMPNLHMHDLRHAAAADLLRSGVTLGVAAQVLGHSPQVLARRYGHLETKALRAAQEQRWSAAA